MTMVVNGYEIKPRADLRGADLHRADLRRADLCGADLHRANLFEADLRGADLHRAILTGADLRGADLCGAILTGANLSRAILCGAILYGANLIGADLRGAILYEANLIGAILCGANLPDFQIPQEGELIGWKVMRNNTLCKLRIPPEAKRTASLIGRKCRAEFAEVLEGRGIARYDESTQYVPGQVVRPHSYNDDPRVECAPGIHFFLTKAEAEMY